MASGTDPLDGVDAAEGEESDEAAREGFGQVYQGQIVINHIHERITNAKFGFSGARPEGRRTSGPVPEEEIKQAAISFVRHDAYTEAERRLKVRNVAVLVGGSGTGKRTAALNLLRDVVAGRRVVELSPAYTLEQLAAREYRRGYGYLLSGWPKDDLEESVADFSVRETQRRVREAGAYLVVTATATTLPDGHQVRWTPPPVEPVLRAYQVPPAVAADVRRRIAADHAMSDIVGLARELASGASVETALGRLESAGRRDVAQWFAGGRTRGEIFEMAAMVFAAGLPERTFERLHARLEAAAGLAPEGTEPVSADDPMPSRRMMRVADGSLFTVTPGGLLCFRVEGHRTYAMQELYRQHGMRVWDPVTEWLHESAAQRDPAVQLEIARGVAILAQAADYRYVEKTFLTAWAKGEGIMRSQAVAALAVSWLCLDETTRPQALRTVNWWGRSPSTRLRFTATLACSGELGIRFPLETVRLLWYQIRNHRYGVRRAQTALARLFTALTEATGNALPVLDWLDRQVADDRRVGRAVDPLKRSILQVLSARADGSATPSVTVQLRAKQEAVAPLARLWASILVNRPLRREALASLYDAVCAFDERDHADRARVRALFAAIVAALPEKERPLLAHDLRAHAVSRDTDDSRLELLMSLLRLFLTLAAAFDL